MYYSLGTSGAAPVKKVEMDGVGDVNGVPLFEYDVDAHDKPWKLPGKIMYNCSIKDTVKWDIYDNQSIFLFQTILSACLSM